MDDASAAADGTINGPVQPGSAQGSSRDKETVKVVVRCRPLFGKEITEGRKPIVTIDTQACTISIRCPENDQSKSLTFDSVYDEQTTQQQFYEESGYPLVESIFEGYNGTIFAYGQTGCGKTHTMQGKESPPELRGVIPHSFDHIFENINADANKEYMVRVSYLEIYNEDIRDLLGDDSKKKLDLKESVDGTVYVKDLTEVVVSDVDSMNKVMMRGFKNRTVGSTLMNEGSSRSHSIFTVVVESSQRIENEDHFRAGKLNLVDLAGSERQSKTGATGNRLKEGCKINLSLSALGNVISALVDGKGKHIPYRDSKLTRLLQDSLGGNTKTLMVAAVSPADYNYDETLSTLRYANRAKNIKNKPIVNEDPKDAKLREYKEEIDRLKKLLEKQSRGGGGSDSASGMSTPTRPATPQGRGGSDSRPDSAEYEAALAKEREEIARCQQEANAMFEHAKRMMEEAKALQEKSRQAPSPVKGDIKPASSPRQTQPKATSPRDKASGSKENDAEATAVSAGDTDTSNSVDALAIAQAAEQAAKIDAEAKEMMARAQKMMQEAEKRVKQPPRVKIVKEVVVKEVIPHEHVKEKEELKEINQTILDQRDRMGKELERKQQEMEEHLREKEELTAKLKKIEGQILGASTRHLGDGRNSKVLVDSEIALLKQQVEYRRAQIKLREKIKKEAQYEAAKKALTLEKQMIVEELKKEQETAQANLAAARKKEYKYKAKLEAARQEVNDLTHEFERERENLLDTIREQTKESKLLEQLVEIFLPQNELVKVWERAVWNEEKEEWTIPRLKPRSDFQKIKLPALGGGGSNSIESGGAEVVSDDDGPTLGGSASSRAPSTATDKRRRSLKSSNGSNSKPSSSNEASLYSSRQDEHAPSYSHGTVPAHPPARAPESGRLPSAVRTSRHDPKDELPSARKTPSSASNDNGDKASSKSEKPKKSKTSKDKDKEKDKGDKSLNSESIAPKLQQVATNNDTRQPNPPYYPSESDLLSPLTADSYQPRDRLQSRQGSRQGGRSDKSSSQSSLGEFDCVPPIERNVGSRSASRGTGSRSGTDSGQGSRRPQRKDDSTADTDGGTAASSDTVESSPDMSMIKKKSKHKKRRKDKQTADDGDGDYDDNEGTSRLSPEDQD
ncbi:TPA: hypothetical protein N0F65_009992 [Lagenidium giganteum]|uniref:Kinesin motor domain-containing protein n=1 Tax=Lagenidium giganteum TaxID=4803 RepID=A0AAV2ZDP5_9STRA|nr:TPA: hypothetical protein N0F65_009992 [Lagenidium giganteum]